MEYLPSTNSSIKNKINLRMNVYNAFNFFHVLFLSIHFSMSMILHGVCPFQARVHSHHEYFGDMK